MIVLVVHRYLKCVVQEFNVCLDKGFLLSLYDVFPHLIADSTPEVHTNVKKLLHFPFGTTFA